MRIASVSSFKAQKHMSNIHILLCMGKHTFECVDSMAGSENTHYSYFIIHESHKHEDFLQLGVHVLTNMQNESIKRYLVIKFTLNRRTFK